MKAFGAFEVIVLAAGISVVSLVGTSIHHWMWEQAKLFDYRSTINELAATVQSMASRAHATQHTCFLHVDARHNMFQLAELQPARQPYETVGRTIWLPDGLYVSESPPVVIALPTGELSQTVVVVSAPSLNRIFRLTTRPSGIVQCHEEQTL